MSNWSGWWTSGSGWLDNFVPLVWVQAIECFSCQAHHSSFFFKNADFVIGDKCRVENIRPDSLFGMQCKLCLHACTVCISERVNGYNNPLVIVIALTIAKIKITSKRQNTATASAYRQLMCRRSSLFVHTIVMLDDAAFHILFFLT